MERGLKNNRSVGNAECSDHTRGTSTDKAHRHPSKAVSKNSGDRPMESKGLSPAISQRMKALKESGKQHVFASKIVLLPLQAVLERGRLPLPAKPRSK